MAYLFLMLGVSLLLPLLRLARAEGRSMVDTQGL